MHYRYQILFQLLNYLFIRNVSFSIKHFLPIHSNCLTSSASQFDITKAYSFKLAVLQNHESVLANKWVIQFQERLSYNIVVDVKSVYEMFKVPK